MDDGTELTIIWHYRRGHWAQYPTAPSMETLINWRHIKRVFSSLNFSIFVSRKNLKVRGWHTKLTIICHYMKGHWARYPTAQSIETFMNLRHLKSMYLSLKFSSFVFKKNLKVRGGQHRTKDYLALMEGLWSSICNCAVQGNTYEPKTYKEDSVHKCYFGLRSWILSSITPPIESNDR